VEGIACCVGDIPVNDPPIMRTKRNQDPSSCSVQSTPPTRPYIDVFTMADTKKSLEITQGRAMAEPAVGLMSRVQSSEVEKETFDPEKPYPTEEEFATLPRVPGSIPWTAWTVAIVEFAERFSYYGTTAVCEHIHNPTRPREVMKDLT
jgi:hypothetical protein